MSSFEGDKLCNKGSVTRAPADDVTLSAGEGLPSGEATEGRLAEGVEDLRSDVFLPEGFLPTALLPDVFTGLTKPAFLM